jgi:hypothetical protein
MEIEFFGCHSCGKVDERRNWIKNIVCPNCGSKRVHPVYLSTFRLLLFILTHPSYIFQAIKER